MTDRGASRPACSILGRGARAAVVAGLVGILLVAPGCRRFRHRSEPPPPLPAPFTKYQPGEFKPVTGDPIHPPEAALRAWRVLPLQEKPRPRKNPRWMPASVDRAFGLRMPEGSHFLCLLNPVEFRAVPEESMMAVERWELLRPVRCSSDGWHTVAQSAFSISYAQDGTPGTRSGTQSELYLAETIHGEKVDITVLLRPD